MTHLPTTRDTSIVADGAKISGWFRLAGIAILLLTFGFILAFLPVREYIEFILTWTQGIGYWGYLVLILAYIVATVLFIPGSLLTIGAGFLFGVIGGSIAVSIGSTLGATAAFLVGRTLARNAIERKVEGNSRFRYLDQAVGREGFKIVFLTRLSPVFPFNLLNYAYGLTSVGLFKYVVASWLGMIPGTILYVYLGSAAQDMTEIFTGGLHGGTEQQLFKIAGLVATVIVTVLVTRIASKSLKHTVEVDSHE